MVIMTAMTTNAKSVQNEATNGSSRSATKIITKLAHDETYKNRIIGSADYDSRLSLFAK